MIAAKELFNSVHTAVLLVFGLSVQELPQTVQIWPQSVRIHKAAKEGLRLTLGEGTTEKVCSTQAQHHQSLKECSLLEI